MNAEVIERLMEQLFRAAQADDDTRYLAALDKVNELLLWSGDELTEAERLTLGLMSLIGYQPFHGDKRLNELRGLREYVLSVVARLIDQPELNCERREV